MLPADWREQMVEMVRGARPAKPDWFRGGPALSGAQQLGVYQRQYELRTREAAADEARGVVAMLEASGVDSDALLGEYLHAHPSRSWTLQRIADELAPYLARRFDRPELVEMAQLDHAVQRGFQAAPGTPLSPSLSQLPPLQLAPHVTLLRSRFNVHELRSAALQEQPIPELREGDYPLVVFRRGTRMRHWAMPLDAWGLLSAIAEHGDPAAAIEVAVSRGWLPRQGIAEAVGDHFRDYAERDLVQAR